MSKQAFFQTLQAEVERLDNSKTSKRNEKVITGFTKDASPKAIINGREVRVFNSNDYLGLRHHPKLKQAEHEASETFGTGPGAVRFIAGTLEVHVQLEEELARFHNREAAMVFSSAFAANNAVLFSLSKGQVKDSLLSSEMIVISDELNHRSIIDGIRLAQLPSNQRMIFKHMDVIDLEEKIKSCLGMCKRVLIVTDGVFSMLGEYQDLKAMHDLIARYDDQFEQGILLVVDDAHGVAACGETGRGVEEIAGVHADVLIGTLGKGFGADGGYVVGSKVLIDYLREASATYIYSNSVSPGTAGAALAAVTLLDTEEGKKLLASSRNNIEYFKTAVAKHNIQFASESTHPIQPVLIGDPAKTKATVAALLEKNILTTGISYPVVSPGRDEIRVQIAATHTKEDIDYLVEQLVECLAK